MIAYKVVEKNTRWGSNWAMFKHSHMKIMPGLHWKKALAFKKEYPKYFPRYFKNYIIKAVPNSPGILCFRYYRHAQLFICRYSWTEIKIIIIKVEGFGIPKDNICVHASCGTDPRDLIAASDGIVSAPYGTIGFKKVRVLE
jgi:hypothetical protein